MCIAPLYNVCVRVGMSLAVQHALRTQIALGYNALCTLPQGPARRRCAAPLVCTAQRGRLLGPPAGLARDLLPLSGSC